MPAYAALLPMGFALPPALPRARWALTPPFHPYRRVLDASGGGLFSVALSSALPLPGVTRHRALRSSDFPPDANCSSDDRPSGVDTAKDAPRAGHTQAAPPGGEESRPPTQAKTATNGATIRP